MEPKSQYGQDNINYMSECPALGMPFTGTIYQNKRLNKKIMKDNKITTSFEYRKFLQKNAVSLMKSNYEQRINKDNSVNRCKASPHGGLVDKNGVIGPEGEDNMKLQTANGEDYVNYFDTKPMLETRCNSTVPACQRVVTHSHDMESDEF